MHFMRRTGADFTAVAEIEGAIGLGLADAQQALAGANSLASKVELAPGRVSASPFVRVPDAG